VSSFNRIILVGRLTRDPEIRYTPSGAQLAKFGLAVNRIRSKNNETDFFNIVAWGKLADICGQYIKKGRLVLIEGEAQTRSYETQDGQKRKSFEIRAQNMQMLETKRTAGEYDKSHASGAGAQPPPDIQEIDVKDLGVDEWDAEDMPF